MNKEVLEAILQRVSNESSVARVVEVDAQNAFPKGENYASSILRVKAKLVLANGRTVRKNFILKKEANGEETCQMLKANDVFKREVQVYKSVLKEMHYLMEEFSDVEEPLWCNLIHHDEQGNTILLEDLQPLGYRVVKRQKGLDLDHALLAMTGLGRYHGMAKVLEQRGLIAKQVGGFHPFLSDKRWTKIFLYGGFINLGKAIKKYWGPEWEQIADKFNISFEIFYEKVKLAGELEENEFTVQNHGDCWSNNLLFKYDRQNRPISIRFVDYQMPYYGSSCIDVNNVMHFGIRPDVRRQSYTTLLQYYHDALTQTLDRYGYEGSKPSLDEIKRSMDRMNFYGFAMFASWYPITVTYCPNAYDIEASIRSDGEYGYNDEIYQDEGLINKMAPDLEEFVKRHL